MYILEQRNLDVNIEIVITSHIPPSPYSFTGFYLLVDLLPTAMAASHWGRCRRVT